MPHISPVYFRFLPSFFSKKSCSSTKVSNLGSPVFKNKSVAVVLSALAFWVMSFGVAADAAAQSSEKKGKQSASLNCPEGFGWSEGLKAYLNASTPMSTDDTANVPTDDCLFHQWSWETFVWATALIDGKPRFLGFKTPHELDGNPKENALVLATRSGNAHGGNIEGAGAIVEADGNMMVGKNGYPVYGSIHMNDSYFNTVQQNLIKNDGASPATTSYSNPPSAPNDYFQVGAAVFKATWYRLDKGETPPEGAYTTRALVPVLKVDTQTHTVVPGGETVEVTVALVGLHVVGYTENHPEFLWGSFEHKDNVPTFKDNTFDPQSTDSSPKNYTFYTAGTPWNKIAEDFANGNQGNSKGVGTLSFGQTSQKFSPVTNAVQENVTGGENQPNGPENIASLNTSAQGELRKWKSTNPAQAAFANYYLLGTVWMAPNTYTDSNPDLDQLGSKDAIGSVNLANSTAETFFQVAKNTDTNNLGNCFACHNPSSFTYRDSCGGKPKQARRIALSHVVSEGTDCAVANSIVLKRWCVDVKTSPIANNAAAQTACPEVCSNSPYPQWQGQWTNTGDGAVCGCCGSFDK